jgi:hypothetical protein
LWEERIPGVTIYKNNEYIKYRSITLTIKSYLEAPYKFWKHTNKTTKKESIFLNTITNNFLKKLIITHIFL